MNRFFHLDNPVISFLSRLADYMLLNLLFLVCCIPVVTIGASLTAMHYVILKQVIDKEEPGVFKAFFQSFRQNLKQATVIWLLFLLIVLIVLFDVYIFYVTGTQFPAMILVLAGVIAFLLLAVMMYIFPLLARFENTTRQTIRNSMIMSLAHFPKTVIMMLVYLAPFVLAAWMPGLFPIAILLGFSGTTYVNSGIWKNIFSMYAGETAQKGENLQ